MFYSSSIAFKLSESVQRSGDLGEVSHADLKQGDDEATHELESAGVKTKVGLQREQPVSCCLVSNEQEVGLARVDDLNGYFLLFLLGRM